MAQTGRPTKRTPDVEQRLLTALRGGATRKAACAHAGVSERSFQRWCRASVAFASQVEKAEADCAVQSVARIRQAAQGGQLLEHTTITTTYKDGRTVVKETRRFTRGEWTADAWYLERKHPDEWGRRDRVTLETVRQEAERVAAELGVPVEDVLREASGLRVVQ